MPEIRVIPGFPLYGASADGRIWSQQSGVWTELVQSVNGKYGYCKVNLVNGRLVTKKVHCLVALCFLGPRPPKHDVNHLDGDKRHNSSANLEYCTRSRNIQHAYQIGLMTPKRGNQVRRPRIRRTRVRQLKLDVCRARGERVKGSKLTVAQVETIRRARQAGTSGKELAERFGVSAAQISRIWLGRKWRHVNS